MRGCVGRYFSPQSNPMLVCAEANVQVDISPSLKAGWSRAGSRLFSTKLTSRKSYFTMGSFVKGAKNLPLRMRWRGVVAGPPLLAAAHRPAPTRARNTTSRASPNTAKCRRMGRATSDRASSARAPAQLACSTFGRFALVCYEALWDITLLSTRRSSGTAPTLRDDSFHTRDW
jgi:hypothetical protein